MIPDWFLTVITVGVAVMALAMLVQMGTMLGLYLAVRRVQDTVQNLVDRQIEPLVATASGIAAGTREIVERSRTIVDDAGVQVEELSRAVQAQVAKVDQLVTEATDRARLQIIRADELLADTLNRVERSVDYIEQGVLKPLREMRAVVHGINTAVGHLKRRGRPDGPERVTQDEEMFI